MVMNITILIIMIIDSIVLIMYYILLFYMGRSLVIRYGLFRNFKKESPEKNKSIKYNSLKFHVQSIMVIVIVVWTMALVGGFGTTVHIIATILNDFKLEKYYQMIFVYNGKPINIVFLSLIGLVAFLDKKAKGLAADIGVDWPSIFEKKWWLN